MTSYSVRILLLCLCVVPLLAAAQQGSPARKDKDLLKCLDNLKVMDGYRYRSSVLSLLVGDTQKKAPVITDYYQSRDSFILYSRSDDNLIFICDKGMFKTDITHKEVYYKLFTGDSSQAGIRQAYLDGPLSMLDSIFLTGAAVAQKKHKKNMITYRIGYAPDAMMKEMRLTIQAPAMLPVSISYTVARPMSLKYNGTVVKQQVTMDQYRKTMPEEVRSLLRNRNDLYHYLQQQYPDYTIKNI